MPTDVPSSKLQISLLDAVVVVSGYVAEAFQAAEPLPIFIWKKPVNPEELSPL